MCIRDSSLTASLDFLYKGRRCLKRWPLELTVDADPATQPTMVSKHWWCKLCIHSIQLCRSSDTSLPPGTFGAFFKDQSKIRRRSFECFLQLFEVTSSVLCQTIQNIATTAECFQFLFNGNYHTCSILGCVSQRLGIFGAIFYRLCTLSLTQPTPTVTASTH